jgi:hypothetical protein
MVGSINFAVAITISQFVARGIVRHCNDQVRGQSSSRIRSADFGLSCRGNAGDAKAKFWRCNHLVFKLGLMMHIILPMALATLLARQNLLSRLEIIHLEHVIPGSQN